MLNFTEGTVKEVRKKLKKFNPEHGMEGTVSITRPIHKVDRDTLAAGLSGYSEKKRRKIIGLPIGPKKRVYPYRDKIKDQPKEELLQMINKKATYIIRSTPEKASHKRKSTGEYVRILSRNSRSDLSDYEPIPKNIADNRKHYLKRMEKMNKKAQLLEKRGYGIIGAGMGGVRTSGLSDSEKNQLRKKYNLKEDSNITARNLGRGLLFGSLGALPGTAITTFSNSPAGKTTGFAVGLAGGSLAG